MGLSRQLVDIWPGPSFGPKPLGNAPLSAPHLIKRRLGQHVPVVGLHVLNVPVPTWAFTPASGRSDEFVCLLQTHSRSMASLWGAPSINQLLDQSPVRSRRPGLGAGMSCDRRSGARLLSK
jgi:hypothetical protein